MGCSSATHFLYYNISLCEVKKMIKGVGIDSVEVKRVAKIVERGDSFAKKVLTPNEFAQYQKMKGKRKVEYLGVAFH